MRAEMAAQHQSAAMLAGPLLDRLLLEFGVSAVATSITAFGNLGRSLIFISTARACGPFGDVMRPVSVNALAESLNRPFETTRRNANELIASGLVVRTPTGLAVPLQALANPRASEFIDRCHDLMVRLIEDLRAANLALPSARNEIAYDPRVGVGIAFDLILAGYECHTRREANLTRLSLMSAIHWANHRFGGGDPVPVKTSTIARIVGLPYATVSRNIDILVSAGVVIRSPDGLVMHVDHAGGAAAIDARLLLGNRARQLIGRLAQAGFPIHSPATAYIAQRPPLPALG